MKRLFISQPMRGKTDEEILHERKRATAEARALINEEVEVIDSFFETAPNNLNTALWCLGESIKLMSTADIVFMVKGWKTARGCRIEREAALKYGLRVIEYIGDN